MAGYHAVHQRQAEAGSLLPLTRSPASVTVGKLPRSRLSAGRRLAATLLRLAPALFRAAPLASGQGVVYRGDAATRVDDQRRQQETRAEIRPRVSTNG